MQRLLKCPVPNKSVLSFHKLYPIKTHCYKLSMKLSLENPPCRLSIPTCNRAEFFPQDTNRIYCISLNPPRGTSPVPAPSMGRPREDVEHIDRLLPLPEESFAGWCQICNQRVISETAHTASPRHKERDRMHQALQVALAPGPQQQAARRILILARELSAPVQRTVAPLAAAKQKDLPEIAHLLDMNDNWCPHDTSLLCF